MARYEIDYGNIVIRTDSEYIAKCEREDGLTVIPVDD